METYQKIVERVGVMITEKKSGGTRWFFDKTIDTLQLYRAALGAEKEKNEALWATLAGVFMLKNRTLVRTRERLQYTANIFYDNLSHQYVARESGYAYYDEAEAEVMLLPFIHINVMKTCAQLLVPPREFLSEDVNLKLLKQELQKLNLKLDDHELQTGKLDKLFNSTGGRLLLKEGILPVQLQVGKVMLNLPGMELQLLKEQTPYGFLNPAQRKCMLHVYKDQAIGNYELPIAPRAGKDIYDKIIPSPSRVTAEQFLGYGPGLHVDKITKKVYASTEGSLRFALTRIPMVTPLHTRTQDIREFVMSQQDLVIEGSVLTNGFLQCSGNVLIRGNIQGGKVFVDGELLVEGGVHHKAYVKVGKDMECQYVSGATIVSHAMVRVRKYVVNSQLIALGGLCVEDPTAGRILGGECFVGGGVAAAVGGSLRGVNTAVEVLRHPQRYLIKMELTELVPRNELLTKQLELLKRRHGARCLDETVPLSEFASAKHEVIKAMRKQVSYLYNELKNLERRQQELEELLRHPIAAANPPTPPTVRFMRNVFPGLRVTICNYSKLVHQHGNGVEFLFDEKRRKLGQRSIVPF